MGYDAAIVGSGIAGMSTGIILAKHGLKTIVLEHGSQAGGLMQVFRRGSCQFSAGVHCVGSLAPGQIGWRYFKYLGVFDRLRPVAMDPEGFQEYRFPGSHFRIPYHHEPFRQRLLEMFPTERQAIERYLADMADTVVKLPLYTLAGGTERVPSDVRCRSVDSYLNGLTCSRELRAVLTAINPFYAMSPAECPLYVHFVFMDAFLASSWRIDETHYPLAKAFTDAYSEAGGEIRCGCRVEEIESVDGQVKGLRIVGGEFIEAAKVIFTGHPKQIVRLCADKALRPISRQRLNEAPETTGVFGVAMAWEGPNCPFKLTDTVIYGSWNTGEHYRQRLLFGGHPPRMLHLCASPAATAGKYSVLAFSTMRFDEFVPWEDTHTGSRPETYNFAKSAMGERILSVVKDHWPDAGANATVVATFTPLTFRDYTLTARGSANGLKKSIDTLYSSSIGAATRVKGLYMAGQSVVLPGLLGAMISGVEACCAILGREHLVGQIVKETE
jgi:all-trans-retinol 13,14-reductase